VVNRRPRTVDAFLRLIRGPDSHGGVSCLAMCYQNPFSSNRYPQHVTETADLSDPPVVSVSRRIDSPVPAIFEVLRDPKRHHEFDGSTMARDSDARHSKQLVTRSWSGWTTRRSVRTRCATSSSSSLRAGQLCWLRSAIR
jgi:hypothetical protein